MNSQLYKTTQAAPRGFLNNLVSAVCLCGLLLLGAAQANAGILFIAPAISAPPNSSGSFDVMFQNTGPDVAVGGFSFGIYTTNPDITFTEATIATAAPYIFAADSLFGPIISTTTGTALTASDLPGIASSYNVPNGATVALGRVSYTVAPNASNGLFSIVFDAPANSLSSDTSTDIPITAFQSGSLNITDAPEPGSFGLVTAAIAVIAATARRRRGRN